MGRAIRYSLKEEALLEAIYQQNGAEFCDEQYGALAESMGYTKKQVHNWYNRRRDRDENIPPKRRFTLEQRAILEAAYQKNKTPNKTESQEIAKTLNIEEVDRVRNWFQARRYPTMKIQNPAFLYSKEQRVILVAAYLKNRHPIGQELVDIAKEVGAPLQRVRSWFLNRRSQVTRHNWNPEQEKFVLAAYQENRKPWSNPIGVALSRTTIKVLENAFKVNPQPTNEELQSLQEKTKLEVSRITFWFDRKRRSTKKQESNVKLKSREQLSVILTEEYKKKKYRTTQELNELADQIGVDRLRVRGWFRYRIRKDDVDGVVKKSNIRTRQEKVALNEAYKKNRCPNEKEACEIADRIGIATSQVRIWFQRRRLSDKDCEEGLQAAFHKSTRPSVNEQAELADTLGLTRCQVRSWFNVARKKHGCPLEMPARLTTKQKDIILTAFRDNPNLSVEKREELANLTGLTKQRINNRFYMFNKINRSNKVPPVQTKQEEESDVKLEDVQMEIKVEHGDVELDCNYQDMLH